MAASLTRAVIAETPKCHLTVVSVFRPFHNHQTRGGTISQTYGLTTSRLSKRCIGIADSSLHQRALNRENPTSGMPADTAAGEARVRVR